MTLQPFLAPVKGAPDFILSVNPQYPDELFVFLGMALLERVPRLRNHVAFPRSGPSGKMLLGRLYNARVQVQSLVECFGIAHTTLRRWGLALLSKDMDRIRCVFSGQGAERKITPEIEGYVRDRFHELYGHYRNYNQMIREEVKKYFKIDVSAERLRWIFAEERKKLSTIAEEAELQKAHENLECDDINLEADTSDRASSCEIMVSSCNLEKPFSTQENNCLQYNELIRDDSCKLNESHFGEVTPNYSLWEGEIIYSGRSAPKKSRLLHHAGLVLLTPWLDQVTGDLEKHRDIIRQWFAQVLLGAVNHEQSKTIAFSSLEFLVGPSVSALNHQRYLLGQLASIENTLAMLKRNTRLLDLSNRHIFYYDPHVEEYTGFLKILKGWCGGMGRVNKVLNLDFIHTLNGSPCFVQHFDNYYDVRERFFMCTAAFRRILPGEERSLTWIADRGLHLRLKALQRVVEMGDHIVTWEKGYARDGWDDSKESESFTRLRPRNYESDLLTYEFCWQESPWTRDSRFRRIVVRARNPNGNEIEVAILASDREQSAREIIILIFSRWLQENNFSYLINHFGIDELTSRTYESYSSIEEELTDRQVRSREYKALMQKKRKVESSLSRLPQVGTFRLLNRQKQEKLIIKKRRDGDTKRKGLESEFKDLESQLKALAPGRDLPASAENDDSHQKTYRQLERKKEKSYKALEKLIARLEKEEEAGKGKLQDLEVNIREKTEELEELEKSLPEGPDRGDGNGT